MTTASCPPAPPGSWGRAADGCAAVAGAETALADVTDALRGAFPERWQSTAADEYAARLTDLLFHAGRLGELVEAAQDRAVECAAAVARALSDQ